jgi:hypothetical protein
MATQKPRITVTLTTRQHEVLRSISESSGQPMSAFLSEMLEVSMPTLERMAVTFHKLKQAQSIERERYLQTMDETQTVLEGIAQQAVGQFDLFMAAVADSAVPPPAPVPAQRARAREGVGASAKAPATNRGATAPSADGAKPKRSKASKAISKVKVLKKTAVSQRDKKGVQL